MKYNRNKKKILVNKMIFWSNNMKVVTVVLVEATLIQTTQSLYNKSFTNQNGKKKRKCHEIHVSWLILFKSNSFSLGNGAFIFN